MRGFMRQARQSDGVYALFAGSNRFLANAGNEM
jgi:hypothetical protein